MYCRNCGNELKENEKYCHVCGVNIEEFNYINSVDYNKEEVFEEKIDSNRIFLYLLVPIAGFISSRKSKKNKIAILISSIIGSFIYFILIFLILTSLYIQKNLTYTYNKNTVNGEEVKMSVILFNNDDNEGAFYISGSNFLNTYIQVDYNRFYPLEYELEYSGYGYWIRTRDQNIIELQFISETMKLEIEEDYEDIIKDTFYNTYAYTLGSSKIDKLLEGKRVTVKYNLGAVNSPININESNKTFKYIEIE